MQADSESVQEVTCVNCPIGCTLSVRLADGQIVSVQGQQCPRGEQYARSEVTDPRRMLTTLVVVNGHQKPLPVRTTVPIPKHLIPHALKEIHHCLVPAPVRAGAVIIADLCDTGISVIATADVP